MPYPPALNTSTSAITTAASCAALIIVRTLYTRSRPKGPPLSGLAALPEGAGQLRGIGGGDETVRRVRGDVVAGGRDAVPELPGDLSDVTDDIHEGVVVDVRGPGAGANWAGS